MLLTMNLEQEVSKLRSDFQSCYVLQQELLQEIKGFNCPGKKIVRKDEIEFSSDVSDCWFQVILLNIML